MVPSRPGPCVPPLRAALSCRPALRRCGRQRRTNDLFDAFIKDVREKITPGTSALFVLTSDAVLDRVAAEFRGSTGEIIHTNLSQEEEAKLHAAFDED